MKKKEITLHDFLSAIHTFQLLIKEIEGGYRFDDDFASRLMAKCKQSLAVLDQYAEEKIQAEEVEESQEPSQGFQIKSFNSEELRLEGGVHLALKDKDSVQPSVQSSVTLKDFSDIISDYQFFEAHSTEAQAILSVLLPRLHSVCGNRSVLRLMDFGCGSGRFTEEVTRSLSFLSDLELRLIEPVEAYREEAIARLRRPGLNIVQTGSHLSAADRSDSDVIISNHVLYYVSDLQASVRKLLAALARGGTLFVSLGTHENSLIQAWDHCFSQMGEKVPYFRLNDFKEILFQEQAHFELLPIRSQLKFQDTWENRGKILRFILGASFKKYLQKVGPLGRVDSFFNPYSSGGVITMPLFDELLIIRK